MNELFKIILSLSLSGSMLILILLICKPLLKNKTNQHWQYYIWLIVIARLLLPFTPETSPIGTLFQEANLSIAQTRTNLTHTSFPIAKNNAPLQSDEKASVQTPPSQSPLILLTQNLWLAWLIVALLLFIRKITIYQGFVNYIRAGSTEVADPLLLDRLALIEKKAGVKRPVELYINSLISSPLLIGFFRPCIVLPTADLPDEDFHYTILHELIHYKHLDMFYKWLVQLTICLHWFNPLVYVMSREVSRTCELACDEAIIQNLEHQEQRAYGDTLLNALRINGHYKNSLASVTLNESKTLLKERLTTIMNYKRKSKLTFALSFCLTLLLLGTSSFAGAYATNFKSPAPAKFQAMNSTTTTLYHAQDIKTIDINATIGNLTILYGDKPQIKISDKLMAHASLSYDHGTLIYRDDFNDHNLSFDKINDEDYKITLTLPTHLKVNSLSVNVGLGPIDLQNISADHATLTATTQMNLNGFHSSDLTLNSTLANISATNLSILKALTLHLTGSRSTISGDIKGNILLDTCDISETELTFLNANRSNYFIKSSWQPKNKDCPLPDDTDVLMIDGKNYDIDYTDANSKAPNKLTIISRELMPLDNVSINFKK